MSTVKIKEELHRFIEIADDRFLAAVYAMMQNYLESDESIVAYSAKGEPLTRTEFIDRVKEAHGEANEKNVIASETLKKEMENW